MNKCGSNETIMKSKNYFGNSCMLFTVLNIFFDMMLKLKTKHCKVMVAVCVHKRLNSSLFYPWRLLTYTKTIQNVVLKFPFANDADLVSHIWKS